MLPSRSSWATRKTPTVLPTCALKGRFRATTTIRSHSSAQVCRTVPRTTYPVRYGPLRPPREMAVQVARTAWYGLLVPVPQQLLGNRTKWPYWPVRFASKSTKVFRPYHAVVRRVISIVHESTNHSRLADPYLGMNGGPLCLLEPPPGRHRYTLRGAPA